MNSRRRVNSAVGALRPLLIKMTNLTLSIVGFVLILSLSSISLGQKSQVGRTKIIVDRFASFEGTSLETEHAILDNFAVSLSNAPDQIGYIIVYAGRSACAGEAQARGIRMKDYLVNYRHLDWNRVIWKDAGHLEKPHVLLEMQLRGVNGTTMIIRTRWPRGM